MEDFISEIVDAKFAEAPKLLPNAAKSAATRLKNQLVEELENFLEDDSEFGRSRALEAIEKGLTAAYNNYEHAKYKNGKLEEKFPSVYHSRIAEHRARFAFYQYLKATIFTNKPASEPKPSPQASRQKEEEAEHTMRQIAILHIYLGIQITVGNRVEIAADEKFKAPTSGGKLYDTYNTLRSSTDRVGKHRNAVRDIEKVISILNEKYPDNKDAISRAEDELKIAKANNI